jgi:hypothetical protein
LKLDLIQGIGCLMPGCSVEEDERVDWIKRINNWVGRGTWWYF